MFSVDWGTVGPIGALVAATFGYLSRQMARMEDRLTARIDGTDTRVDGLAVRIDGIEARLTARIDQLTERYISHLERHPH